MPGTRQSYKRQLEGIPEEQEIPPKKKRSTQRSKAEVSRNETPMFHPPQRPPHEIIDLDPEYEPKRFRSRTGGFPRFAEGSVYIQIAESASSYSYVFEKSDLARVSEWFAHQFEQGSMDNDLAMVEEITRVSGYDVRFELRYREEYPHWVLKRSSFTKAKGSIEQLPYNSPAPKFKVLRQRQEASAYPIPKYLNKKSENPNITPNSRAWKGHPRHTPQVIISQMDGPTDNYPSQESSDSKSSENFLLNSSGRPKVSFNLLNRLPSPFQAYLSSERSILDIGQPHPSPTPQTKSEQADMLDADSNMSLPVEEKVPTTVLPRSSQHDPSPEDEKMVIKVEQNEDAIAAEYQKSPIPSPLSKTTNSDSSSIRANNGFGTFGGGYETVAPIIPQVPKNAPLRQPWVTLSKKDKQIRNEQTNDAASRNIPTFESSPPKYSFQNEITIDQVPKSPEDGEDFIKKNMGDSMSGTTVDQLLATQLAESRSLTTKHGLPNFKNEDIIVKEEQGNMEGAASDIVSRQHSPGQSLFEDPKDVIVRDEEGTMEIGASDPVPRQPFLAQYSFEDAELEQPEQFLGKSEIFEVKEEEETAATSPEDSSIVQSQEKTDSEIPQSSWISTVQDATTKEEDIGDTVLPNLIGENGDQELTNLNTTPAVNASVAIKDLKNQKLTELQAAAENIPVASTSQSEENPLVKSTGTEVEANFQHQIEDAVTPELGLNGSLKQYLLIQDSEDQSFGGEIMSTGEIQPESPGVDLLMKGLIGETQVTDDKPFQKSETQRSKIDLIPAGKLDGDSSEFGDLHMDRPSIESQTIGMHEARNNLVGEAVGQVPNFESQLSAANEVKNVGIPKLTPRVESPLIANKIIDEGVAGIEDLESMFIHKQSIDLLPLKDQLAEIHEAGDVEMQETQQETTGVITSDSEKDAKMIQAFEKRTIDKVQEDLVRGLVSRDSSEQQAGGAEPQTKANAPEQLPKKAHMPEESACPQQGSEQENIQALLTESINSEDTVEAEKTPTTTPESEDLYMLEASACQQRATDVVEAEKNKSEATELENTKLLGPSARQQQVIEGGKATDLLSEPTESDDVEMEEVPEHNIPEKLNDSLPAPHIEPPNSWVQVQRKLSNKVVMTSPTTKPTAIDQQPLSQGAASLAFESIEPAHKPTTDCGVPWEICEIYNNFFLLLHDLPPDIDTKSIDNAFEHIQSLVDIAEIYSCVHKVRTCVSNHLLNFGRELFEAISHAPPQWLQLSIVLQCAPIFKEAITHIVGRFPAWSEQELQLSGCPEEIQDLIKRKVAEAKSLQTEIKEELFKGTIVIDGKELSLFNLDESTYNSWFVVQAWRDWFFWELRAIAEDKHRIGTIYRSMAKESYAYLPAIKVYEKLLRLRGGEFNLEALQGLEEDMELMKRFARQKVKPLVVNHSMLDVEASSINYLTCNKVDNHELPWFRNGGG